MTLLSRNRNITRLILAALVAAGVMFFAAPTQAATLPARFPRLVNYYLNPDITKSQALALAQWDMVILGAELQYTHPEIFPILRQNNPNIILLAYVPSEEIPTAVRSITDPNHPIAKLLSGVPDSWWFTDTAGQRQSIWPGTQMINVTDFAPVVNGERWNTYLPKFVHANIMSTGLWDGIFYDNVFPDISWIKNGNVDLDRNGVADDPATADAAWRSGMTTLLSTSRALEGVNAIIIGNGAGQYFSAMNGRLIEDFPSPGGGNWVGGVQTYFNAINAGFFPAVTVINGKSTTDRQDDYRAMRYTFATTLLSYGFFSFDLGSRDHSALWRYDEYRAYLGLPLGAARNLDRPTSTTVATGLWRRDFRNGIVLVNATDKARTVTLGDGYVALLGSQDPAVNHGQPVKTLTIPARDGRILLKQVVEIDNGTYTNGTVQRVFTSRGQAISPGFFSYNQNIANNALVIREDIDGDALPDRVVASGDRVYVSTYYGQSLAVIHPFQTVRGRLSIAVGDVDGDGRKEIIVGSGRGMMPRVKVFRLNGKALAPSFLVYAPSFRGGVNVAAGDLDGDGRAEIITGAGAGGGPHVRTFTASGQRLSSFFVYEKNFRGGVNVAAGDINSDGRAEIIVAPGAGRRAFVRMVNAKGQRVFPGFTAFGGSYRAGITISVSDVNHDSRLDIIASPLSATVSYTANRSIQALTN
jgi:hypothetical protein